MAYVLSLKLDLESFQYFNELRQAHFPPERNFLPAHLTLFHALPDREIGRIKEDIAAVASRPVFPLRFGPLYFMGFGTSVLVSSSALLELREELRARWAPLLHRQDLQKFRPHVTIQNKVSAADAKALYSQLSENWLEHFGRAEALLLWEYMGGPWRLEREFPFHGVG